MPTSKISILDDHPAAEDLLDFKTYQEIISNILQDPDTSTPLAIGLFGTWGSGKTSLMRMLQDSVERNHLPYTTVWFNAWKYNREEVLWRALILRVLDALRTSKLPNKDDANVEWERFQLDLDYLEEVTVEQWEQSG